MWCWCNGRCQRGYSLYQYCNKAGISLPQFLKNEFYFEEAAPNEVNKMDWSANFLPLSDPRSKSGVDYIKSRGLDPRGDMYYDINRCAIVFPYYFHNIYVGAQIRFLKPEGDHKMETVPGTRTGLLFYGWNQDKFVTNIRGVIVTEGAFNALSLQQALDDLYGGVANNPWKCMASSGAGSTKHQIDKIKELKELGYKIVVAPDYDDAGHKMLQKLLKNDAITHYAFTMSREADWNDLGQKLGKKDLAKFFLQSVKKVS
jgi:DNA primase